MCTVAEPDDGTMFWVITALAGPGRREESPKYLGTAFPVRRQPRGTRGRKAPAGGASGPLLDLKAPT
ncbi:hypothetical protein IBTHAUMO2_690012 [Nitrosopumilaceae archaeon]|nr:hypothetical protein IBTHAUMO2_690012 [Nitrosopumilaceae archaeon]